MTVYCSFKKKTVRSWAGICSLYQCTEYVFNQAFWVTFWSCTWQVSLKIFKRSSACSNMRLCNLQRPVISGYLLCQLWSTDLGIHPHVCTMVIHVWACGLSPAELTKGHILTNTHLQRHTQAHYHRCNSLCKKEEVRKKQGEARRETKSGATCGLIPPAHIRAHYRVLTIKERRRRSCFNIKLNLLITSQAV